MEKNQNFRGVLLFFIFLVTTVTNAQTYKAKQPPEANSEPLYQQLRNAKLSGDSIAVKSLVFRKDAAVFTFKEGRFTHQIQHRSPSPHISPVER